MSRTDSLLLSFLSRFGVDPTAGDLAVGEPAAKPLESPVETVIDRRRPRRSRRSRRRLEASSLPRPRGLLI